MVFFEASVPVDHCTGLISVRGCTTCRRGRVFGAPGSHSLGPRRFEELYDRNCDILLLSGWEGCHGHSFKLLILVLLRSELYDSP